MVAGGKGEESEIREIASMLNMDPSLVSELVNISREHVSLDSPVYTERDSSTIGDFVEDEAYKSPDQQAMEAALRDVGLGRLASRLDQTDDWSRILSLGEQQRLAFARVLLVRPQWVFLDEATSALDEPREQEMYDLLRTRLPGLSIVSVGHRSTLFAQHDEELHLTGDGSWDVRAIAAGTAPAAGC